jgi:RNA polymerase sigma-70 factor (ECF subfamily)
MIELSDSQLAVTAGKGDADAYRRLFERYQHPVYNFVYRMVDNAEDASDIVQDAFIKVYSVLADKEIDNFSAYLYRTAKNLAYDEMRRRSRFADVDHEILAPEDPNIYADPQRALLLDEQMGKVRQATNGLNEKQRAALILRELEGLDYDEMSEVMESNRNAIGALLSRARLKFREELRMVNVSTDQVPEECEGIIALLSPYIDGELAGNEVENVETHLEHCTFCTAALEEMQEASRSFRIFIPVIPPADMAEAFTGRLDEAMQAAGEQADAGSDASSGDGVGGGSESTVAAGKIDGSQSLASRLAASRYTWIAAALVIAIGLSAFLLVEDVGRDSGIADLFPGDQDGEQAFDEIDFQSMDGIRPAHATGIVLQDGEQPQEGEEQSQEPESPATEAPVESDSAPPDEAATGTIVSGSASPNPVYEGSALTITVSVSGDPDSVTVDLGGSMTVPLTFQYGGSQQVWSWSGLAPGYGDYSMTATADFPAGAVSAGIGTLTVWYLLY